MLLVSVVAGSVLYDGQLSRSDGIFLLFLAVLWLLFIVKLTCISQPKKTTLRDKAMVNYAFDYLSSPGSLPFTTAATELSAIHGHSTSAVTECVCVNLAGI